MKTTTPLRELLLNETEAATVLAVLETALPPELCARVRELLVRLPELAQVLAAQELSVQRLKKLLFGPRTEKARRGGRPPADPAAQPKPPRPGHGRRSHQDYPGARRIRITNPLYQPGSPCPSCHRGKLRPQAQPATVVTVHAQPPVGAVIHELERLRCDACGEVFTAPLPPDVAREKYDANVGVMVGLLRYGTGLPFHRLARLQTSVGVPLPSSIQWAEADRAARALEPVVDHLLQLVAQGTLFHSDDTTMRVRQLQREIDAEPKPKRTGIFTTAILGAAGPHPIHLVFTGRRHAGENLARVLERRAADLAPPLHMCDGLAANAPPGHVVQECSCNVHGRRNFVELETSFPEAYARVIQDLGQVYAVDAECGRDRLSPADRLARHQARSAPVMANLKEWFTAEKAARNVEPNSGLGQAIDYMLNRWEALTRFLTVAGAPLDNNLAERVLKTVILHRKNSLHYRTVRGAAVGDAFMSLIQTCAANGVNPFDYLVAVVRHAAAVAAAPERWLPWNYRDALAAAVGSSPTSN